MDPQLSAGTARTDITPPVGIAHANWGAQTHERAGGVDLPLWGTALALSDGETTVVIVDLDLLYLWPDDASRIRDAVAAMVDLPRSNIRLSYTHTHSGPTLNRETWADGAEMIDPYLTELTHRVAGLAWEAIRKLRPAHLATGRGTSRIAVNRRFARPGDGAVIVGRNPDGPVDHEVLVVRIDAVDGDPIATVVNYACHPITVGPDNDLITPDYPGAMKRVVEDATDSRCLFLQGATGNVGPVRGVARGGIDEYKPLGRRLGHEVCRVWWGLDPRNRTDEYVETLASGAPLAVYETTYPEQEPRPIDVHTRTLELELRELPTPEEAEAEYERHADRLHELRDRGANQEDIREAIQAARQVEIRSGVVSRFSGQSHETLELQVFIVGDDLALAAIPGEPFVQIGQRVKSGSSYACTLFSGYSNEGLAYIPTRDAYPDGGYEVEITPFAPGAAERIVAQTVDELSE